MKQRINNTFFWMMLLLIALGFSTTLPPAFAQPWEFILAESNELPDGKQYGTVSLDYIYDPAKRGVRITVTANKDVLEPCSNFGIQKFAFNTTIINAQTDLVERHLNPGPSNSGASGLANLAGFTLLPREKALVG